MPEQPSATTRCVRPAGIFPSTSEPLVPPIQVSAVARVASLDQIDDLYEGREAGYTYRRDGDPNSDALAAKLAELEGAEDGLICASGMGAEGAIFLSMLNAGDEVALSGELYGKTVVLARAMARFGVTHSFFDASRPESLRDVLSPRTRLVWVETLSNPLLRLADLEGLSREAHRSGALLAVDHTFAPLLCRPIERGADLVMHSLTKLIGGHSDLILGFLGGSKELVARARAAGSTFGLIGNPFESWLAMRGVATLGLRVARTSETALRLAHLLARHELVRKVYYPGLPDHPDHERAGRQLQGFGAMMTIDAGGRAEADALIRRLKHIPFAPTLGDVATTLSHPATTSHRNQSAEQWAKQGITPGLIRLSIGLEDVEDLWSDLKQALDAIHGGS